MNKEIKRYLICTFTFAWVLWGILVVGGKLDIEQLKFGTPLAMLFFIIGGLAPTICEIGIKKKYTNKKEFNLFIKNIINPKHNIKLYILAIGLAFTHCIIPIFSGGATVTNPIYVAIMLFPMMIIGGGLEEVGWRGFLQSELEKKLTPVISTLIVGVVWGIWHLPLWFINGSPQSNMSFMNFCISGIGLSFLLAGIYNLTESIFLSIIFHACINSLMVVFTPNDNLIQTCIVLIFDMVVFLVLTYLNERKRSYNNFIDVELNVTSKY